MENLKEKIERLEKQREEIIVETKENVASVFKKLLPKALSCKLSYDYISIARYNDCNYKFHLNGNVKDSNGHFEDIFDLFFNQDNVLEYNISSCPFSIIENNEYTTAIMILSHIIKHEKDFIKEFNNIDFDIIIALFETICNVKSEYKKQEQEKFRKLAKECRTLGYTWEDFYAENEKEIRTSEIGYRFAKQCFEEE